MYWLMQSQGKPLPGGKRDKTSLDVHCTPALSPRCCLLGLNFSVCPWLESGKGHKYMYMCCTRLFKCILYLHIHIHYMYTSHSHVYGPKDKCQGSQGWKYWNLEIYMELLFPKSLSIWGKQACIVTVRVSCMSDETTLHFYSKPFPMLLYLNSFKILKEKRHVLFKNWKQILGRCYIFKWQNK